MARTIRYHLDENSHHAIAEGLRRRGIDVTTTPEAALMSASDQRQLSHSVAEARVIFTQDPDFLRFHAAGEPHPGIAFCKKDTKSNGDIIRGLILIWEILEPHEMMNRVEFL